MRLVRILGIDPGSRTTGYGLVELDGQRIVYVDSGCIRCGDGALPDRLDIIFRGISDIIQQHGPSVASVEQVFMARNADSALKLGQARGAAICALKQAGLEVQEYSALQIKQAVVGRGHADGAGCHLGFTASTSCHVKSRYPHGHTDLDLAQAADSAGGAVACA